ncbi:MAG: hypothetical protein CVV03_10220 [Firmicutes bacterium HGW-Firmicutes-8]|nr:MAG: hypothetical protein CVV03_10220 [Firmicutes bacterium HGW-Firmicutes-8]
MKNCSCSEMQGSVRERTLEIFATIRSRCPVLKQIFVPDNIWPEFQKWHRQPDKAAFHRSILLLALERGYLGRVTSAIHRYLITAGLPRTEVRKQYLKDLRERWMYSSAMERHRKFRSFFGKVVELQFAEWLESQGWTVSELEALQEGPDIGAKRTERRDTAFEVKFIGKEDFDFEKLLESIKDEEKEGAGGWSASPYVAANYLLFRAYEAAKQLKKTTYDRIAVLVISENDHTWFRFHDQIKNNWIDWTNPTYFSGDDKWEEFLTRQKTRYPNLKDDLKPTLESLNAVWILGHSNHQFNLKVEVPFGA